MMTLQIMNNGSVLANIVTNAQMGKTTYSKWDDNYEIIFIDRDQKNAKWSVKACVPSAQTKMVHLLRLK